MWQPLIPTNIIGKEIVFTNDLYQIHYRKIAENCVHLSIKRRDREALRDWRHFQQIKNELCGKEWVGIEIYPPESKLLDTSNQFHLWVFDNDSYFPFIFQERYVSEFETNGSKQRPFEDGLIPKDLKTPEEMKEGIRKYLEENPQYKDKFGDI